MLRQVMKQLAGNVMNSILDEVVFKISASDNATLARYFKFFFFYFSFF